LPSFIATHSVSPLTVFSSVVPLPLCTHAISVFESSRPGTT